MLPETNEWVSKAGGDWTVAQRLLEDPDPDRYFDAVARHAQQCAEKYLKARLIDVAIPFPKTHSLGSLLDLLLPLEPAWDSLRSELDQLSTRAVEVRYPGFTADREDATEALSSAAKVRGLVRASLGLPANP